MAFLKVYRHVRQHGVRSCARKLLELLPGYVGRFYLWRVRRCKCCDRITLFLANGTAAEFLTCLFCSANERYELLATEIKTRFGNSLAEKDVLELDPHSPLKKVFSRARTHLRTFYEEGKIAGSGREDGAVCQDITALTSDNESFDLIVSSDVLEHVPQLSKAFDETARVLKPGGAHVFTVPPRPRTRKRAEVVDGKIHHIEPPDYHRDPLSPQGILAFWDIGPDLPQVFSSPILDIRAAGDPSGDDGRVVWIAERRSLPHPGQSSSH